MYTVVVYDRHIARLPVIAHAVVNLVTGAIENIECRFIHMAVLLGFSAGAVFLQMQMQGLGDAILGLYVMTAVGLRPIDEFDLRALAHARQRAQARQFFGQIVVPRDGAHKDAILFTVIV